MNIDIRCWKCGGSVTVPSQQQRVFCSTCGNQLDPHFEETPSTLHPETDKAASGDSEGSTHGGTTGVHLTDSFEAATPPVQRAVVVVPLSAVVGAVVVMMVLAVGGTAWWMSTWSKSEEAVVREVAAAEVPAETQPSATGSGEHATNVKPENDRRAVNPVQELPPTSQEMKRADRKAEQAIAAADGAGADDAVADDAVAGSTGTDRVAPTRSGPAEPPRQQVEASPVAASLSRSEVIELLRSVTAFIRVRTTDGLQTGSGFLYRKDRDSGIVVTNAHVVKAEDRATPEVSCVFHSGSKDEISVRGRVMGMDETNDLAFIYVLHSKLPEPLDLSADATIQETSTVLAAGYPFGEALKTGQRNPAITITQGGVSSIRRDDAGNIVVVQVDGGINPGNSGGPVVDAGGRLVGVAVAKVTGTSIGFAIPKRILESSTKGRATAISFEKKRYSLDEDSYFVKVELTDPVSNIKKGQVILYDAKNEREDLRGEDGAWVQAAENLLADASMSRGDSHLSGICRLVPPPESIRCQIRLDFGSDRVAVWTQPFEIAHRTVKGLVKSIPGVGREFGPVTELVQEVDDLIELPAIMSDFAINPRTRDIGCVGYVTNSAFLVRAEQDDENVEQGNLEEISIEGKPFRITYKEYGQQSFFVVACHESPEVHLLDATTFALVGTVHCEGQQVRSLAGSANWEDPFLYYEGERSGRSYLGVIDLRSMVDLGQLLDNLIPGAVSFQGKRLYVHSHGRPSFIESRSLLSKFSGAKPTLSRHAFKLQFDSDAHPFVYAPSGRFVVNGSQILSPNLRQQLAELDFDSFCCFRTRPVIAGFAGSEGRASDPRRLCIASSNSFESVGKRFQLPRELILRDQLTTDPRLTGLKSVSTIYRTKVIADDLRDEVVVAVGNRLARLPLERFEPPAEERLELNQYSADFVVGQEQELKIKLIDGKGVFNYPKLLDGMKRATGGIRWRPKTEHVGRNSLVVEVSKWGQPEKQFELELNVTNPYIQAPFDVTGFAADPGRQLIVCWSHHVDERGKTIRPGSSLAVVPYRSEGASRTTELDVRVKDVVLVGKHAAIIPDSKNPRLIHFYDIDSLQPVHEISLTAPLREMRVEQDRLLLILDESVDSYDATTLEPIDSVAIVETNLRAKPVFTSRDTRVVSDGIWHSGVLYNSDCTEPKLIVSPGNIRALEGASPDLLNGSFLRRPLQRVEVHEGFLPLNIPATKIYATPRIGTSRKLLRNSFFVEQLHITLELMDDERNLQSMISIVREDGEFMSRRPETPCRYAGDEFLVGCGTRVYRWSPKTFLYDLRILGIKRSSTPAGLHFVPTQTAFVASKPTTVLKHTVAGGTPPYSVSLAGGQQGISLDAESGEVILSRQDVLVAAIPLLGSITEGSSQDEWSDRLRQQASELADDFHERAREKLTGYPVAVPICLKATDDAGENAELQYFVLVDLPFDEVIDQLR